MSKGVIYILTNPSFPQYVKIGYADDVETRLKDLNRSECIPFAFRIYATYDVEERLTDLFCGRVLTVRATSSHTPIQNKAIKRILSIFLNDFMGSSILKIDRLDFNNYIINAGIFNNLKHYYNIF